MKVYVFPIREVRISLILEITRCLISEKENTRIILILIF